MNSPFQFADGRAMPFVYDGRDRLLLPESYSPGNDVVIIGRGKLVQHHPANIRYRAIILSQLDKYSSAQTKGLKSSILRRILNDVRNNSANRLGFVKRDTESGRWCAVNDDTARINIAQAFRDGLHSEYKSSKKHKQQKRNEELGINNDPQMDAQLQQSIFSALNRFETKLDDSEPSAPPPRPSKRVRVTTNNVPPPADEQPSDHTFGRLGGTMDRLYQHLIDGSSSNNIIISSSSSSSRPLVGGFEWNNLTTGPMTHHKRKLSADSIDTFTRLCSKLPNQNSLALDSSIESMAFKPMQPAAENKEKPWSTTVGQHNNSRLEPTAGGEADSTFPIFAMSIMVDKTNPTMPLPLPLSLPINNAPTEYIAENKIIFDQTPVLPSSCRSEIISSLSLNSLALSDSDETIGMNSVSGMNSLSSISESLENHGDMDLQDAFEVFGQYRTSDIEAVLMY